MVPEQRYLSPVFRVYRLTASLTQHDLSRSLPTPRAISWLSYRERGIFPLSLTEAEALAGILSQHLKAKVEVEDISSLQGASSA